MIDLIINASWCLQGDVYVDSYVESVLQTINVIYTGT